MNNFEFHQCIFNTLYLEKGCGPSFDKFLSLSPKDALYYVWLKLAKWFCETNILIYQHTLSVTEQKNTLYNLPGKAVRVALSFECADVNHYLAA